MMNECHHLRNFLFQEAIPREKDESSFVRSFHPPIDVLPTLARSHSRNEDEIFTHPWYRSRDWGDDNIQNDDNLKKL